MITFQTFLLGLLVVSTLTGLVTEAFKKVMAERNKPYYANTLAGIISIVLSAGVGVGYVFLNNIEFASTVAVYLIALMFMSWLCAMVGYDKVVQALSQFKTSRKDEEPNEDSE